MDGILGDVEELSRRDLCGVKKQSWSIQANDEEGQTDRTGRIAGR